MANMQVGMGSVETNLTNAVEFSMSQTNGKKLIAMLSNFLYTDKEYAVLSELSANGVDAHRMVGKEDEPIRITMPTPVEPDLVIRDYGPGMSEPDLFKFLTQFGESSKQDDANAIGFYGIGSKSVASVSSTWSLVSHHNGKMIKLEVFVNGEGSLALSKVFEGKTEESGLEVRIPIEKNKFHLWESAAHKAFKHYRVLPKFNRNIGIVKTSYKKQTEKYGIRSDYVSGINVITTMREYPLDAKKLGGSIDQPLILSLFKNNIDLFFETSSIDLGISREQIQYNTKTTTAIINRLKEIGSEMLSEIKAAISVAKNGVEYRSLVMTQWNNYPHDFVREAVKGNSYGVVDLPNDFRRYCVTWKPGVSLSIVHRGEYKNINDALRNFNCWRTYAVNVSESFDLNTNKDYRTLSVAIDQIARVKVVLREGVRDAAARVKQAYKGSTDFFVIMEENLLGPEFPVINASSLPKVPRTTKRRGTSDDDDDYYLLDGRMFVRITKMQAEGYTDKVSLNIRDARSRDANPEFTSTVKFLHNQGYYVIGHKGEVLAFDDQKTAMKKFIENLKNSPALAKDIENAKINWLGSAVRNNRVFGNLTFYDIKSTKLDEILKPVKDIICVVKAKHIDITRQYGSTTAILETLEQACRISGETLDVIDIINYENIEKICKEIYPMLQYIEFDRYVGGTIWTDRRAHIQEYVNLIEKGV